LIDTRGARRAKPEMQMKILGWFELFQEQVSLLAQHVKLMNIGPLSTRLALRRQG